jgi:hypothetical protein
MFDNTRLKIVGSRQDLLMATGQVPFLASALNVANEFPVAPLWLLPELVIQCRSNSIKQNVCEHIEAFDIEV